MKSVKTGWVITIAPASLPWYSLGSSFGLPSQNGAAVKTPLVEGDDKPGLGLAIAEAIAGAGVNMHFFVAQAVGRKFSAVVGFATEADANTAAGLIKKAAASRRK